MSGEHAQRAVQAIFLLPPDPVSASAMLRVSAEWGAAKPHVQRAIDAAVDEELESVIELIEDLARLPAHRVNGNPNPTLLAVVPALRRRIESKPPVSDVAQEELERLRSGADAGTSEHEDQTGQVLNPPDRSGI